MTVPWECPPHVPVMVTRPKGQPSGTYCVRCGKGPAQLEEATRVELEKIVNEMQLEDYPAP